MSEYRRHGLFIPLLLIFLGVLLLLSTLKIIEGDIWSFAWRLWPVLLIVGGLDGFYRRDGFVGPALLVGLGGIFLASNLGYLTLSSWELVLRFWPVLLIAFGLDILIGRRSALSAALGVLLGLALVAAILALVVLAPTGIGGSADTQTISQPLQGATLASVSVVNAVGQLNLSAGASSGRLAEGQVTLAGLNDLRQDFSVDDGRAVYRLESQGQPTVYPFSGNTERGRWELQLTSAIPLELSSRMLLGSQQVDLRGLKLERFDSETILGSNTLTLPEDTSLNGSAKTTIGELVLRVPRHTAIRIQVDTGITTIHLPEGYYRQSNLILSPEAADATRALNLKVELPIGSLRVEYLP